MLILSANVGEGHAAAARALHEQLEGGPDPVEVTVIDGLRAMGRILHYVVEDGYRTQLRVMPWSYSLTYWLLEHLGPARWVAKKLLYRLGARGLRARIAEYDPDVIVSTYPAVTVVLGRMRERGLVDSLTVATITDMTGLFFWAQRGIDMHLVMYDESLASVERIAGSGSVRLVRPLISANFLEPCGQDVARAALGLPVDGKVIVVSGGGWGVGDIAGAVDELASIPDATLVCLAGKNDLIREKLSTRFADDPRVRVLGFTDKMPELLAAADVLVHSTGGVTCLEAMARGCPVVSYGLPVGHAKINTQAMADLDLVRLAKSTDELLAHVTASCGPRLPADRASAAPTASELVLQSPRRVRTIPAWRPRLAQTGASLMLLLSAGTWMLSTDEFTAFAASVFAVHTVKTVATKRPEVDLIVRAPQTSIPAVARHLQSLGVHATFALTTPPTPETIQTLRSLGDAPMCEVDRTRALRWMQTRGKIRREARALHLRRHFFYLAPDVEHMPAGQLLAAKTTGARPVVGSVQIDAGAPVPARPLRRGDIAVITLDGSTASLRSFDRFAAELAAERLAGVAFSLTG